MNGQTIDKSIIKTVLEDMLRERNPELQSFLEGILAKYLAASVVSDQTFPLDRADIRKKYALRREAFIPLNALFQDTLPASELTKLLSK
jgi:hypothetical protein